MSKFYSTRIKKIQKEHSQIVEKMTSGGIVKEMSEFEDKKVGNNIVSADPMLTRNGLF